MDYNSIRRKTKQITVGRVKIGGDAPVSVQSMTNTDTMDFDATYAQISAPERAGCDIVRLAVPKIEAAKTIYRLKEAGVCTPLVAEIHFDYKIALECVECGADKIRINPGNIGADDRVRAVANACANRGIPIRVGVNSGSLNKEVLAKHLGKKQLPKWQNYIAGTVKGEIVKRGKRTFQNAKYREMTPVFVIKMQR
jgi:(E)-4-hydroxy-3-methylbut-2-enyl-diphosphate synthase